MSNEKINLKEKLSLFDEHWTPKIIAELNGQQLRLAKVKGEFVWHDHTEQDELFLVLKGSLTIKMHDRDVHLNEGELFIVPKGVEHKPVAEEECHLLLFEPGDIAHTGDVKSELTIEEPEWI